MSFTKRMFSQNLRPRDSSHLVVEDIDTVRDPLGDEILIDSIRREVERNYVSHAEIAGILEQFGASDVADYVRKYKYPSNISVRNGDFGEIITGAIHRQVKRYCVPILKLRWKQQPNQPVQGADVVGFRFTSTPITIVVSEVKTRTGRARSIGKEAHESLNKILPDRLGEVISFIYARLQDTNPALASQVVVLLDPKTDKHIERSLSLVQDESTWNENILDDLRPLVTDNTLASVVRIPSLGTIIDLAYGELEVPLASDD